MPDSPERVPLATKKDFRIDWFSGTGAGGQNRNKVQTCCRITHIPTGLTAQCQTHRTREGNRKEAFGRLAKLVVDHYLAEEKRARYTAPGEVVRTYHEPDNRVKDHASGFQQTYTEVVEGSLDEMIEARRMAMLDQILTTQN